MKIGMSIALLIAVNSAFAARPTQQERTQIIWDSVHNRFVDQVDYWYDDGDYPRCIQLLRIMADLEPNDFDTVTDLGFMLENTEQFNEALALYVKFRKDNPKLADGPLPEATFYFKRKTYSKVPPLLQPVMSMSPDTQTYRMLAEAYEKLGLLVDAKKTWLEFLKRFPNDLPAEASLKRVEGKINAPKKPS